MLVFAVRNNGRYTGGRYHRVGRYDFDWQVISMRITVIKIPRVFSPLVRLILGKKTIDSNNSR